ncbi:MAG: hypothetical protein PVJ67_03370 [Candidatus Pacearchaeota archaeon]|jgi:hypothetical protein
MNLEKIFRNEKAFCEYIKEEYSKFPEIAEKIILHEKAHYEKAKELNYNPFYAIGKNPNSFYSFVPHIIVSSVSNEDELLIVLAPEIPSHEDLDNAEECFKKIQKEKGLAYAIRIYNKASKKSG